MSDLHGIADLYFDNWLHFSPNGYAGRGNKGHAADVENRSVRGTQISQREEEIFTAGFLAGFRAAKEKLNVALREAGAAADEDWMRR